MVYTAIILQIECLLISKAHSIVYNNIVEEWCNLVELGKFLTNNKPAKSLPTYKAPKFLKNV